ncbi:MAG: RNA polymerase sigma factor [Phycisphaerae bacterium]|nr:RNA polymerase sigma factor [Phycisphaerae bacterium]NUQ45512.1 RNA polymerase sigma factor [Phycisphaerae bacterium]
MPDAVDPPTTLAGDAEILPRFHAAAPAGLPGTTAAGPESLAALRRRLLGLAVKLVWNRDDAEDIVQEAFSLALTRGPSLTDPGLAPWAWRTVTLLCLNRRRRRRSEPLPAWVDPPSSAVAGDAMERTERLERLRTLIDELPDQQRVAVVLRLMEGLSYEEVAGIMGLTSGAVRTHVHLARTRLAKSWANETGEPSS